MAPASSGRWVLIGAVVVTTLAVLPTGLDPVGTPKATVMGLLALVLLGLLLTEALTQSSAEPLAQRDALLLRVACGSFVAALVTATVTSPRPLVSVVGYYPRYSGLAIYVCFLIVVLAAGRWSRARDVDRLLHTLTALNVTLAIYGVLQAVGIDPIDWDTFGLGGSFATLGNANFLAGYLGITTPALLFTCSRCRPPVQIVARIGLVASALAIYLTRSQQGVVVALLSGLGFFALQQRSWLQQRWTGLRQSPLLARGGAAILLLGALGGMAVMAPRILRSGLEERQYFYQAAVDIFRDNVFVGSGLDTFGFYFPSYRPAEHALVYGGFGTDAVHSVPLGMFSNGGLLLGGTYVMLVVSVGLLGIRAFRTVAAEGRARVAAVLAAWLAYHLQSLISIDIVPLVVLHAVLAGSLIAMARSSTPPGTRDRARGGRKPGLSTVRRAAWVSVLVALLFIALPLTRPLRADLMAGEGRQLVAGGRVDEGLAAFDGAVRLAPWEAQYRFEKGIALNQIGDAEGAYDAVAEAAVLDFGWPQYARDAARLADFLGRSEEATRWYRDAVNRDPREFTLLVEAATYLEPSNPEEARDILLDALALRDDSVEAWALLGDANEALGRSDEALMAIERALALTPGDVDLQARVEALRAAG